MFVSIGRNRRVYPRDLIGLILQNVEMERDHIGDIRVLDNYSFVQVITEDAEKIIQALNEFEYRGRKLAVSYSRKKEESGESTDERDAKAANDSDDFDESESPDFRSSALFDSGADDDAVSDAASVDSWSGEADLSDNEENNADI